MASSYCIGQQRYRVFLPSQKVVLDNSVLENELWVLGYQSFRLPEQLETLFCYSVPEQLEAEQLKTLETWDMMISIKYIVTRRSKTREGWEVETVLCNSLMFGGYRCSYFFKW